MQHSRISRLCLSFAGLFLAAGLIAAPQAATARARTTLKNPLLPSGADPWVTARGGFYYFMATTGNNLTIRKTRNIADLASAETKVVWTPPAQGPYSHEVWAPELHFLNGKWYIYFAADDGKNETHRIWALEGCGTDPLECEWTMKGKVADPADKWAIDPTVLQEKGQLYFLWAGWEGDRDGTENLYIARMENPWTLTGKRVRLSTPEYAWEKVGDRPNQVPAHVNVNEAPEVLCTTGRFFLFIRRVGAGRMITPWGC
jgi:GH43 family beta-xylosidase